MIAKRSQKAKNWTTIDANFNDESAEQNLLLFFSYYLWLLMMMIILENDDNSHESLKTIIMSIWHTNTHTEKEKKKA